MKWSFKLGRILGIDVYTHFTFLILLGFIAFSQILAGGGLSAACALAVPAHRAANAQLRRRSCRCRARAERELATGVARIETSGRRPGHGPA